MQHSREFKPLGFIAFYVLVSFFLQTDCLAKALPLSSNVTVSYSLKEEPLSKFLKRFFVDNGLNPIVSDLLNTERRTLNGLRNGSPRKVLLSITESNGVLIYYDGRSVFLYKTEEIQHRYFHIEKSKTKSLQRTMRRLKLNDKTNFTLIDKQLGLVEVSGAPQYVEQVQQLIQALTQTEKQFNTVFRYIPLKYAWASDRFFTAGNKEVTIPGVANMLRQVVLDAPIGNRADAINSIGTPKVLKTKSVKNTASVEEQARKVDNFHVVDIPKSANNPYARIVADPYRNAVIIRDLPERIPLYLDLISKFDIPSKIIEIEATIIDINTDKLRNMGMEWRYSSKHSELMFAQQGTKNNFLSALVGNSTAFLGQIPGFQLGAIIGDENQFISRINLLEKQGVLSVMSRPKVATLNDMEAVIESSRSLFVPVEGAYETDLFQVFSGTVLRVTPHIIEDAQQSRIRLMIAIEDGTVELISSGVNGQDLPLTTRHAVLTQAVINEGHSLLLGGLIREEEVTETSKVPLLSDIPLLGHLFKNDSISSQRTERLFLISPRILTPDGTPASAKKDQMAQAKNMPKDRQNKNVSMSSILKICKGNCSDEYGSDHLYMF